MYFDRLEKKNHLIFIEFKYYSKFISKIVPIYAIFIKYRPIH